MLEFSSVQNGPLHSEIPGFVRTEHPHVVRVPGIGQGEPIIENTRISVRLIAGYFKEGATAEDILRDYPFLNPAAIYDAISYYLDHTDEIESLIVTHTIDNVLARQNLKINETGVIYQPDDGSDEPTNQALS